jgi:hypothetical protein
VDIKEVFASTMAMQKGTYNEQQLQMLWQNLYKMCEEEPDKEMRQLLKDALYQAWEENRNTKRH